MVQQQLGTDYEPDNRECFDVTQVNTINKETKNTPKMTSRIESWITCPTPFVQAPKTNVASTQAYTYNRAQTSVSQAPKMTAHAPPFIPGLQVTETLAFAPITSIQAPFISLPQEPKHASNAYSMKLAGQVMKIKLQNN